MTAKQKRDAYERMLLYPNALIVGTHALIQERAVYENLALVITDEQHRFGVRQRETLGKKEKTAYFSDGVPHRFQEHSPLSYMEIWIFL